MVTLSVFESLTIMKHEILVIRRKDFGINVRHSCCVCDTIYSWILLLKRLESGGWWTYCFVGSESGAN